MLSKLASCSTASFPAVGCNSTCSRSVWRPRTAVVLPATHRHGVNACRCRPLFAAQVDITQQPPSAELTQQPSSCKQPAPDSSTCTPVNTDAATTGRSSSSSSSSGARPSPVELDAPVQTPPTGQAAPSAVAASTSDTNGSSSSSGSADSAQGRGRNGSSSQSWHPAPAATATTATATAADGVAGGGGTAAAAVATGPPPQAAVPAAAAAAASSPSFLDRAIASSVFLLPLTEGLYRLALVATWTCRHNALDLMMWAQVHAASLSSSLAAAGKSAAAGKLAEELQACNMMAMWSSAIYSRLTQVFQQLLTLTQQPPLQLGDAALQLPAALPLPHPAQLPYSPEIGHWLVATFGTPVALVSLCGLVVLAGLMQYAQLLLDQREAQPGRSSSSSVALSSSMSSSEEELSSQQRQLLRRPDMVLLACTCAVLLRIAWVPLTSLSGLAVSVYSPLSIMLTLAATYFSAAAFLRMWWVQLPGPALREGMGEMAEGVLGVVLWHRTLVLLDWMLSAFSGSTFTFKMQLAAAFMAYSLAVEYLSKLVSYSLDAKHRGGRGSSRRGGAGNGGAPLWVGAPSPPKKQAAAPPGLSS